jgi:hypothetical protein
LGWGADAAFAGSGDGGAGKAGDGESEIPRVGFLGEGPGEGEPDGAELVVEVVVFGSLAEDAGERGVEELAIVASGEAATKLLGGGGIITILKCLAGVLDGLADDGIPFTPGAGFAMGPADDRTLGGVVDAVGDDAVAGLGVLTVHAGWMLLSW